MLKRLLTLLALAGGLIAHAHAQTYPGSISPQTIAVNQFPFNATCDGVANDTTPIQNALNSVSATGGTVLFPPGKTCKITTSLVIGNGSSSAASTTNGIVLDCAGVPVSTSFFGGMSATTGCRILWAGSGNTGVINLFGPYQGFAIRNLFIDCNSVASSIGLNAISAQGGDIRNNAFNNCQNGIELLTVPNGVTFGDANNENNHFDNNLIVVPNISGAVGIFLSGQVTDTTTDSHANIFTNTKILLPLTNTSMTGIQVQRADSNQFFNTVLFGGGTSCTAVAFDYSSVNTLPDSNMFYGLDPGSPGRCATSFANFGTPAATTRPNYIYGLVETNGASNPALSNLNPALPTMVAPGISLTGQTASIASTNVNPYAIYKTGLYRLNYDLLVTTAGTGGTITLQISWVDDAGTHTNVNLGGTINLNAVSSNSAAFPLRITSGNNVSFSTTVAGATGSPQYALFIRLEKMD